MNPRFATCASPDYWLFPAEMADYESKGIAEQLLIQEPRVLSVQLGNRWFIFQRRYLDTLHPVYFMAPEQGR